MFFMISYNQIQTQKMLGGLNQGNAGATCQTYWRQMPSGFKFLVVSTLAIGILGIFTSLFLYIFADVVSWTVNYFQIWRLLTSFLVDRSIISVIINLYIISMSLPLIEKIYSSAYIILEILTQTLICNLAFVVLGEIFGFMNLVNVNFLVSYGTMHILFIFLWQRTAQNPEEMTRFCCFPCIMPMKYLPWCFFALLVLFNPDLYIIMACLLGYLQHMVLKRSLLQLPMTFYNKIESILPASVKQSPGFVAIRSVQTMLRTVCRQSRPMHEANNRNQGRNPFQNNEALNDRVEVAGQGVSIGGSSAPQRADPTDYKSHWLKNMNDQQVQARGVQEAATSEAKIQPNKKGNLLDMSEDHNETMRSDYPLNDALDEDEIEEERKKKQEKR